MKHKINILVVNPFGIGDVLFSTPLIKILTEYFSSAKINYICNERVYHLLKNNPHLNEIIIFEKDYFRNLAKSSKIRFLKEFIGFLKKIKSFKTDLMIDLSLNYQASFIGKFLGIPKRIGFNYRNRGRFLTDKLDLQGFEKKHVVLHYLDLLKLLNINISEKSIFTEAFTFQEDDAWANGFIKEFDLNEKFILGVVAGGGKSWGKDARYRRWPVSKFVHVIDRLIGNFNISIILFGDKDEKGLCNNIQSVIHNKVINLGGKTSLGQFMSLVKHCRLFLCNEGGSLHIAVALGVPTVSIFGPVDEKIYGPYSPNTSRHIIVSDRSKCKPCYSKFKYKKCDEIICLDSISEDKVFDAVTKLIESII